MIEASRDIIEVFGNFITQGFPLMSFLVNEILNFGIPDIVTLGDIFVSPLAFLGIVTYGIVK